MKKITTGNYKKDKYYPPVVRAFAKILNEKDYVAPVEVFMTMGHLKEKEYMRWRNGQVPCLERVIEVNLSKINRILRIIKMYAHDLNMKKSITIYHKWGKGKKTALRFSISRENNIEDSYSGHFLWNHSQEKKIIFVSKILEENTGSNNGENQNQPSEN